MPQPRIAMASPPPPIAHDVAFEREWKGFGVAKCQYLAPKDGAVHDDGGVDVVFHFNAGQMSEREMRASGARAVFVACGFGQGGGGYSAAFAEPSRFGWMMTRLLHSVSKRKDVHLDHLALVSWSAGFAAVNRILGVPEWFDKTDAVVLLDSIHAPYVDKNDHTVDTRGIQRFVRFAKEAAAGNKAMVITHTSIVPPGYASTKETTAALLQNVSAAVDLATVNEPTSDARGMLLDVQADAGNLHVRGFRGTGPHDHFDHLHLIGDVVRSWLVPRWYTAYTE